MSPRRLLPYLVVFLVLVGTYVGLRWQQAQKETREEQARQIFDFKPEAISAVTLKRGPEEIHLVRQGAAWELVKPVQGKAEPLAAGDLVQALARLKLERDLGPGDLKAFGLDQPALVVDFTVQGKKHQLSLGSQAPGGRGYYVRRDSCAAIYLVAASVRDSLDQRLDNLRDKTLWVFEPSRVKAVKLRSAQTQVNLERIGPGHWRLVGKPDFRVRADRVEQLLRQLREDRITGFPPAPRNLKAAGLAPQAQTEVSLTTPQGSQTLYIGARVDQGLYARLGDQGQVVQVSLDVPQQVSRLLPILEDRRLFSGALLDIHKVVWGTPGKTWTALKDKDFWQLTGPDQAAFKQSAPRFELALVNFQNLEYTSLLPQAGAPVKDAFTLEFFDPAGKSLFHLTEAGKQGQFGVVLATRTGSVGLTAVVPQSRFAAWQAEMARLTTPPPAPRK